LLAVSDAREHVVARCVCVRLDRFRVLSDAGDYMMPILHPVTIHEFQAAIQAAVFLRGVTQRGVGWYPELS
jgi:hypothetical protein